MSVRIVYDHGIFSQQDRGGISRYFIELASRMLLTPDVDVRIVAPVHMCSALAESGLPITGTYLASLSRTYRIRQLVNDILGRQMIKRCHAQVLHQTYYTTRRLWRLPTVVTVFDMIHERFADQLPSTEQAIREDKKRCVRQADQVICISEQTRADVLELLDIPEDRVQVIHLGTSIQPLSAAGPSVMSRPYLLYVGQRRGPKNFHRLLETLALETDRLAGVDLLCFGGGAFTAMERTLISRIRDGRDRIHQMEGDDVQLSRLYQHAKALVYPSLYEGFGLPLIEAMSCSCPVVCSRTSCLPEIAGEAASYFDPEEPESIAEALVAVLEDTELRDRLISAGRMRAAGFTWETCARKTREVYALCQ